MVTRSDRGQVFALEAIVAALLLILSVVFAIQMTAVTPLTASTSNQQIEGQQTAIASGFLAETRANGTLKPALLYWNDTTGVFHNSGQNGYFTECAFPLPAGNLLERTFSAHGVACNVNIQFISGNGESRTERLVFVGTPTDNAVRGVTTLTLYDDDVISYANGTATDIPLSSTSTFYAPDAAPESRLYNVVQVEVVVWRI